MLFNCFILSLFLFVGSVHAVKLYVNDENDLRVYLKDIPPTSIANETNLMVIEALEASSLEILPGSFNRAVKAMRESQSAVCMTNKLKTPERLKEFIYSLPLNIYLSRRLYQRGSAKPLEDELLDDNGDLQSLALLFRTYPQSIIVLGASISYGAFLDSQLAKISKKNKLIRNSQDYYDTIYDMFEKQRADFFLGYPADIYRNMQQKKANLRAYYISGSPKFSIGYWMCNDTPSSQLFIGELNTHIKLMYQRAEFYQAHTKWLPEVDKSKTTLYLKTLIDNL